MTFPPDTTCAICHKKPSTRQGEHIWPKWWFKQIGEQATTWSVNGEQLTNRTGEPISLDHRSRVLFPACPACNDSLNRGIEEPMQSVIKKLTLSNWCGELQSSNWRTVGLWWAKVLLMLGHSQSVVVTHPAYNTALPRFGLTNGTTDADSLPTVELPDFSWLLTNPVMAPAHVSVFVFHTDVSGEFRSLSTQDTGTKPFVLPIGARDAEGRLWRWHVNRLVTANIDVAAVWHPGGWLEHPLLESGSGWELLHGPPEVGNICDLPLLSADDLGWVQAGAVPWNARVDGGLEPLFSWTSE